MISYSLAELAELLHATLHGNGDIRITGLASIKNAIAGQISFLGDTKLQSELKKSQASAMVLTAKSLAFWSGAALVVKNPYLAYAQLAHLLDNTPGVAAGIAPSAAIAGDVCLGKDITIGANAVIESGVVLGDNVIIGAGCFIGTNTRIGNGTRLFANVTVYHNVSIGRECLIQSGTIIGSDGFGYIKDQGKWIRIPQLGSVRIGDQVEIGASTTIDRGALDDTCIGNGVIIDNQCQIAHNDNIGDHTAVAGGVIMAGSLKIGKHCMIGGASVINGHMEICDNVVVTGMAMVMRPISEPGVYSSGIPLQSNKVWRKTASLVLHIDEINKRLRALEKQFKQTRN